MIRIVKPGRIPCCVPFCGRTAKDEGVEDQEIICAKHWRLADRRLTRRFKRFRRAVDTAIELPLETYCSRARARIVRRLKLCQTLWEQIKTQAIERAVGI